MHFFLSKDVLDDREDMKQRLDSYLSEIARLERIQAERDREREMVAEQLRAGNEDAEIWRSRWEKAESAASAFRADCDEKELELARQRDALEAKEREIISARVTLSATESQVRLSQFLKMLSLLYYSSVEGVLSNDSILITRYVNVLNKILLGFAVTFFPSVCR